MASPEVRQIALAAGLICLLALLLAHMTGCAVSRVTVDENGRISAISTGSLIRVDAYGDVREITVVPHTTWDSAEITKIEASGESIHIVQEVDEGRTVGMWDSIVGGAVGLLAGLLAGG